MKIFLLLILSILALNIISTLTCNKIKNSPIQTQKLLSIKKNVYLNEIDSLLYEFASGQIDTINCNAKEFWQIVKKGKEAIPHLIDKLTDTTKTNIRDRCKVNGGLTIGEISYFALMEIAEFPAALVTGYQFDYADRNNCWSFFQYFFDNKNKLDYQVKIKYFYKIAKYEFELYSKKEGNKCVGNYNIKGRYKFVDDWS